MVHKTKSVLLAAAWLVVAASAHAQTPPSFTSASSTTLTVGTPGSFTLTATGSPAPTFSVAVPEGLPAGLTLNSTTGVISGTPTGPGGLFTTVFLATNSQGVASQVFTFTLNQAPTITSANNTTFTVGSSGSFQFTASGHPVSAFSHTGSLPTGVTLSTSGLLSGTPAAGTGGTYPITVTANNGVAPDATQSFTLTVNQAPAITTANNATFTVGTAGSFDVDATGFPAPTYGVSPSLPSGLSLNTTTGVISGTPAAGTSGVYNLTITATNGVSPDATQAFTLTILESPSFTNVPTATLTRNQAGSFTLTATGFPAPTFAVNVPPDLPTGLSLNSTTGVVSGTPTAVPGTYNLVFVAVNSAGAATQSFTITINEAPAITTADNATFTVGTAGSFDVDATGSPAPTYGVSPSLPSGLSLNTSTGVISGTPAAGTGGVYNLTITATNGVTPDATQAFTLTVNEAPTITSANSTTFTVGTAGSFQFLASGHPASAFSHTGTLPTGVTLSTSGLLSGTPAAGTGGTYPITVTANNGVAPDATQSFTLTVNQAPAITTANNATFTVGTAGSFDVDATGFPAPTYGVSPSLPSGLSLNTSTGVISGTPAAGTGGVYNLTITATNGVTPDATQAFTLTVNEAPTITSANSTTFTVGTAGSFQFLASGHPASAFSHTGTLPTGVTLSTSGLLSGTPAAGTGGTYPITVTANNGVAPDATQSFTLTVNQAPAITTANNATFTVGTAGSFDVDATGFPAPTYGVSPSLPSGLSLNTSTGVISGTPAAGTGGVYNLTITATNGVTPDATQAFTLTVNEAPTITSANSTTFTVGTAGSFQFLASGHPASAFSHTGSLPTGVTLSTSGLLSGTPAAGTGGTYPITVTANNGVAPDATQSFTLTVNQAPAITTANNATFTVGTAGSFDVDATGFPAPTYGVSPSLPSGLSLNTSTGDISGTPAAGTGGVYNLTITATNGVTPDATQAFTLTVNEAPTITSANSTTFTVGTAGSFQFLASGHPASAFSHTGTLPTGVTLSTSGLLSGTPAAGTGGTYPITVTANNGVAPNGTQAFTLTVEEAPSVSISGPSSATLGSPVTYTALVTGFPVPTIAWRLDGDVIPGETTATYNFTAQLTSAGTYTATVSNSLGSAVSNAISLVVNVPATITSPLTATGSNGTPFSYQATATGTTPITWSAVGLPAGLNIDSTTGLITGTPTAIGTTPVSLTATNVTGSTTVTLTIQIVNRNLLRLGNVSLRADVQSGEGVAITGFVIEGATPKRILVRAVGPTLAAPPFNLPGTLPNPRLRVYRGTEIVFENEDWGLSLNPSQIASTSASLGAFPLLPGSADAALIGDFDPGAYTIVIDDAMGGTGTTLIELYEIDTNGRLTNLSSRAFTTGGPSVAISGFVIMGGAPKQVLIRAIGPTLAGFGVASAVTEPRVVLFDSTATVVAENSRWGTNPNAPQIAAVAAAAGAFPLATDSEDAALLVTLQPGVYTVHAVGDTGPGVVLLEIYEVP